MEETKKYDTKLASVILGGTTLFISILLASFISKKIIPSDIHSGAYFEEEFTSKTLGTKIFFICWGIQLIGIIIWYIKKEKEFEE